MFYDITKKIIFALSLSFTFKVLAADPFELTSWGSVNNFIEALNNEEIKKDDLEKKFEFARDIYQLPHLVVLTVAIGIEDEKVIDTLEKIRKLGFDLSTPTEVKNHTLLHLSAALHRWKITEYLTKYIYVNVRTLNNHTPLHMALPDLLFLLSKDCLKTVEILLEHGANPNYQDYKGETILHKAANEGWYQVVQLLLEFGAKQLESNITNENLRTPMQLCEGYMTLRRYSCYSSFFGCNFLYSCFACKSVNYNLTRNLLLENLMKNLK